MICLIYLIILIGAVVRWAFHANPTVCFFNSRRVGMKCPPENQTNQTNHSSDIVYPARKSLNRIFGIFVFAGSAKFSKLERLDRNPLIL